MVAQKPTAKKRSWFSRLFGSDRGPDQENQPDTRNSQGLGLWYVQRGNKEPEQKASQRQATSSQLGLYADNRAQQAQAKTAAIPSAGLDVRGVPTATQLPLEQQAALHDQLSALLPDNRRHTAAEQKSIVGLRYHDMTSREPLWEYNDRFVLLWKDHQGRKRAEVFQGSTHPSSYTSRSKFTDVNGDGVSDMAWLKPGSYEFGTSGTKKHGRVLRPRGNQSLPAWRDVNNNGMIDPREIDRQFKAGGILFHVAPDFGSVSAGCQTLPEDEFGRFMDLMQHSPYAGYISYTLVDVSGS